jgi:hypothetical protein
MPTLWNPFHLPSCYPPSCRVVVGGSRSIRASDKEKLTAWASLPGSRWQGSSGETLKLRDLRHEVGDYVVSDDTFEARFSHCSKYVFYSKREEKHSLRSYETDPMWLRHCVPTLRHDATVFWPVSSKPFMMLCLVSPADSISCNTKTKSVREKEILA